MKQTKKRQRTLGQAISEYMILTALVAVGSIAVIQVMGSNLRARIGVISEAIRGKKKDIAGTALEAKHYEIKDLGDFNDSMVDNEDK